MAKSQSKLILMDLIGGHRITALDALRDYGCFRLSARIEELRRRGYQIKSDKVLIKSRFGRRTVISSYYIEGEGDE